MLRTQPERKPLQYVRTISLWKNNVLTGCQTFSALSFPDCSSSTWWAQLLALLIHTPPILETLTDGMALAPSWPLSLHQSTRLHASTIRKNPPPQKKPSLMEWLNLREINGVAGIELLFQVGDSPDRHPQKTRSIRMRTPTRGRVPPDMWPEQREHWGLKTSQRIGIQTTKIKN